ncbi:MAG TPA: dihydrolipoamide acetyltransferase family protein [Gammaproteobacteria bacterium]|nr:dihydrolipoamide acetyltransferase family protein [Gammaproteobacteria bacterium]
MKTFDLPDLGEGLADAEIVTWHVKEGDRIETGDNLVSVETAKAVVDVPSPDSVRIAKLHAAEGDVVEVHKPLVDFDVTADGKEAKPAAAARPHGGATAEEAEKTEAVREDSGTVVGAMPAGEEDLEERAIIRKRGRGGEARPKAAPAARARARELGVDLGSVEATGHRGQITPGDVERHASAAPSAAPAATPRPAVSAPPPRPAASGKPEAIRGPRRTMAQSMSAARDQVMPTSLFDDADIHAWAPGQDITVRLIRALVAGCRAEPILNAWFDGEAMTRTIHKQVDLALAVDTPDGLIVPVIRAVESLSGEVLRHELDRVKQATRARSVSPQDMLNPTITLSNFGMMAGRYASPVIVPPQVAIVGTGGIRHDVVAVLGGIEVHKRIPLSLTFDHRCATGGEACRYLAALIKDLERAN